jgi:hypothetical protein
VFHINIGEKGLLYPEIYEQIGFVSVNSPWERSAFRHECVEKNRLVTVEVILSFPRSNGNNGARADEFLQVYYPDSYGIVWVVPSSFLKLDLPRR